MSWSPPKAAPPVAEKTPELKAEKPKEKIAEPSHTKNKEADRHHSKR